MTDIICDLPVKTIAVLSFHSCPLGNLGARDTGGMSVYIREVAVEIARMGFKLDIFTRRHNNHDTETMQLAPGVRLIHLEAGEPSEFVDKLALYPHIDAFTAAVRDYSLATGTKYGLVFSHYWLSGIVGRILAADWDVPHMVMFHTLAAVKNQLGLGAIESDLRIQEETRTMQTCQAVVVATEREKQSMVEFYKANPAAINIIPCGVNLDLFRPMDPFIADQPLAERLEKTILYVGRIEPLKGIDILINALALLSNRPDWRCLIVGGGPSSQSEVARLKKLSKKLKLETRLDFTGIVHQEKLPGYYNKAHVLVVPSLYESFGLVALEALASGCPVVASDVGDLRNIITPGFSGEVIETMDASNLAFSLRSWLDHPERDQSARQAIHQTVERFGWKRVALELVNKIERLSPVVYPS